MEYVLAAVFGSCIGVLLTHTAVPRVARVPSIAVVVLSLIGLATATWGLGEPPAVVAVLVASTFVTAALAGGVAWRDHPLLRDSGYWSRVILVLAHERALRRSVREGDSAGSVSLDGEHHATTPPPSR